MPDRVRGASTRHRSPLSARWSLLGTPAGSVEAPDQLPNAAAAAWIDIGGPDTVAGALREAGRWSLDGPSRRFDAEDWWFRAVFDTPASPEAVPRSLMFGGLAGACTVWLNRAVLLTSDNMHVSRTCDVPMLTGGENELLMRFASLDAQLALRRPRPRWRTPMVEHQQLRWARVSLLGRTPGWSPPAPAIGPWRTIEWVYHDPVEVSDLRMRSELDDDVGRLALSIELVAQNGNHEIAEVTLRASRDGASHETILVQTEPGGASYAATLSIPDVVRWWPHTHGEPALYEAELDIRLAGVLEPVTVSLGRLGFRTLTVDTSDGNFALSVNDVPIFCRGANWTPLDVVSPAASPEATQRALAQVQAAGLNMLRVNGCMVYEDEAFFEACDALGLLVWQDFMFANMDYPASDEAFLASVYEEARQQLARWQAHPSLAVICGNSEVEQQAAMWGSPRETWSQPLFEDHLAALAHAFCPDVTYWPSSAHGGTFPHQNDVGTTSYYGIGAYLRPMDDARRVGLRFASESLAFANVPSPATLARMPGGTALRTHHPGWKMRTPRDLAAGWDFEDVRDHYLQRLYRIDPVALRSADHERYLQLSRAVSAEVIEATISEWRRPASTCRGALIWFLRDLWAGAGWGMLDETGTPKAAFHGLRRASAPIRLFLTDEGTNGLALHIVNDPGTPLVGEAEVSTYRDDGLRLQSSAREIAVPAHGGRSYFVGEWLDGFLDLSRAYRFGASDHALVVATLRGSAGDTIDRAFFFPEGLPNARQRDVGLKLDSLGEHPRGGISVSVSARTFAQSVHFESHGYVADDEFFHLAPGESRAVRLVPATGGVPPSSHVSAQALNAWYGATLEVAS
jgi:beta-mannosidase